MTLGGPTTLYCTNDAYFGAYTYCQRENVAQGLLSGGIRFLRIFVGIPWRGASNSSGMVKIFVISVVISSEVGTFGVKANIRPIIRRHEVLYQLSSESKMLDLEWPWDAILR